MTLVYCILSNPRDGSPWANRTVGVRLIGAGDLVTAESIAYGYEKFKSDVHGMYVLDLAAVPGHFYIVAHPDQTSHALSAELVEPPHNLVHIIPGTSPAQYGWEIHELAVDDWFIAPVITPPEPVHPPEYGVLTVEQGVGIDVDITDPHHPVVSVNSDELLGNSLVTSFNSRTGHVVPAAGDYTAAQVGADPAGTAAGLVATALTEVTAPTFVYSQSMPLAVWTVNHPLNKKPVVVTIDSANRVIEGDVSYNGSGVVIITFGSQFSGTALLT